MSLRHVVCVWFVCLFALVGCRSSGSAEREYTLVYLKTGPKEASLSAEDRSRVFQGHMANINRLADERKLLVAGPFGKEKSDAALRGLFVLAADESEARALAATDPAVEAGVFVLEFHALRTDADLPAMLETVLAQQALDASAGITRPIMDTMRSYVIVTVVDGRAAHSLLHGLPQQSVLIEGRLDGTRTWAVLDAQSIEAAHRVLAPIERKLGAHVLDEWFATKRVADFPGLRPDRSL